MFVRHGAIFAAAICAILFNACASSGDINALERLYYKNNDLEQSYKYAQKFANDDFLWSFQSGILAFFSQDFKTSNAYFDTAESFFESQSDEGFVKSGFQTLATILIGNSLFEYYGNYYEATLINYYKALSAMALNDYASARVEFNRANDRQRRAKEYFANRIEARNNAMEENASDYNKEVKGASKQKTNQTLDSILNTRYKNLAHFKVYEDYINPFVSYVSGIFFLLQDDYEKASFLLNESYGISGRQEILQDIALLESRKKHDSKQTYTWIFIEDGSSPKKIEFTLDVPLFLVTTRVLFFNIALPNLDNGRIFYENYYIDSGSHSRLNAFEISNMGGIVANEFDIELPYIVLTSMISSSYKAYLQYLLSEHTGIFGAIAGAVFSKGTTNADVRSSRILPLRFLSMRLANENGNFVLFGNGKALYKFTLDEACTQLCSNQDNIIYIRVLQNAIIPITSTIRR